MHSGQWNKSPHATPDKSTKPSRPGSDREAHGEHSDQVFSKILIFRYFCDFFFASSAFLVVSQAGKSIWG
jgi:hypothetical protein